MNKIYNSMGITSQNQKIPVSVYKICHPTNIG
jgi:hypothetical protein